MKVIMDIVGIEGKVTVSVPDTHTVKEEDLIKGTITKVFHIDKEQAIKMAIEIVCMIKENDIKIEKIQDSYLPG